MSLAVSESRAIEALLRTQPPPVTREISAERLAPGQLWRPTPSLLALAAARLGTDAPTTPL